MTIAISLKVHDGLVLAADSATTLVVSDGAGNTVPHHVYNHANKVFNLRKGLPIGAITWGAGSIGVSSISTLVKDLRRRFSGESGAPDWGIDPHDYSVATIATKFQQFMFDEHYTPAFNSWKGEKPRIGFIVGGYSSGAELAEEYLVEIQGDTANPPRPIRAINGCGANWFGEPEAITRLLVGFSPHLGPALKQHLKVPDKEIGPAIEVLKQALGAQVVQPAMPIQDAVDLAEFLVDLTEKFSRFTPGFATVGGPIEIAAITKHEGFKWVKRKLYYPQGINPEERSHEPPRRPRESSGTEPRPGDS